MKITLLLKHGCSDHKLRMNGFKDHHLKQVNLNTYIRISHTFTYTGLSTLSAVNYDCSALCSRRCMRSTLVDCSNSQPGNTTKVKHLQRPSHERKNELTTIKSMLRVSQMTRNDTDYKHYRRYNRPQIRIFGRMSNE